MVLCLRLCRSPHRHRALAPLRKSLRLHAKRVIKARAVIFPRQVAVNSTSYASVNFSRSLANSASGTSTGVCVIASAYSTFSRTYAGVFFALRCSFTSRYTRPSERW